MSVAIEDEKVDLGIKLIVILHQGRALPSSRTVRDPDDRGVGVARLVAEIHGCPGGRSGQDIGPQAPPTTRSTATRLPAPAGAVRVMTGVIHSCGLSPPCS